MVMLIIQLFLYNDCACSCWTNQEEEEKKAPAQHLTTPPRPSASAFLMRRSSGSSSKRGSKVYNTNAVSNLFISYIDEAEEDKTVLTMDGIVNLARDIGIADPASDVRVLVLLWKLGARQRPGQINKDEFENGMKALGTDSLDKLRDVVPSFDVEFLIGNDFKEFYKFAYQFNLEGSQKTIERDIIVALLPMVMGRRSEYTDRFMEFLNTQKKPTDRITLDQWTSFLEFSSTYPTSDRLSNYDADGAWPVLLDEFVDFLKAK